MRVASTLANQRMRFIPAKLSGMIVPLSEVIMSNDIRKPQHRLGSTLYHMKQSDENRRFSSVSAEYYAYLNEWRHKVIDACKLSGIKKSRSPEWLPYHVKYVKDSE